MSIMNVLALGDIAEAMAADKQRELIRWAQLQRLAASAAPREGGLSAARASVGAVLIRAGGWVGSPRLAPRRTRQLAH